jgi:hypothetical protein
MNLLKKGHENLQSVIEKLKLEKEKLLRQNENLKKDYKEEMVRAASIHYSYWRCKEDNKILKLNLVGVLAKASGYAEHIERLNRKIEKLQVILKNHEQKM